jgi:hypothetical protein
MISLMKLQQLVPAREEKRVSMIKYQKRQWRIERKTGIFNFFGFNKNGYIKIFNGRKCR